MDSLQTVLIFLILLLAVLLSVLGIQAFLILRGLKNSLNKLDRVLDEARVIGEDLQKPIEAAKDLSEAVTTGVKVVKAVAKSAKPARRLFKRR